MPTRLLPGGGVIEFEANWLPGEDPDAAAAALLRLSGYLEDTQIPLGEAAITLENDIRNRFDTETDPGGLPWVDLNEDWAERKQDDSRFLPVGDSPSGDYILRLTGDLYQAATDPGAFVISGDTLLYDPSGLPDYGTLHQTSTKKMPARPFIGISENAQGEIEAEFIAWADVGIAEFNAPVRFDPGVSRYRIPKGMPGAGRFAKG